MDDVIRYPHGSEGSEMPGGAPDDAERCSRVDRRKDCLFWLGLLGLVGVFAGWQMLHLGGFRWDWDEGVYLLTARTVAEGHRLYSDIFSMAPPLFIASLNLAFLVAGETVAAGRAVVVLYSALGLLGVGLLAREWGGRLAGLAAAATLAVAPHFYILSRTVVADLPSMGMGCLALWLTVRYQRAGRRWRLAAAGGVLAWGVCLKLTAGLIAPAMLVAVLLRELKPSGQTGRAAKMRAVCLSALALGVPFAMPFVICLLTQPAGPLIDQVIAILWLQRDYFTPDYADNMRLLVKYLLLDNFNVALNRGLTVLGLTGGLSLALRRPKDILVLGVWATVVTVVLVGYAPLWVHLFSPILFPLAVGAGIAMGHLYQLIRQMIDHHLHQQRRLDGATVQMIFATTLTLALIVYLYDGPGIAAENARRGKAPGSSIDKEMVEQLLAATAPGDFVMTDEPLLAFVADRPVPPDLCDCSVVRMTIGRLTANDLIEATRRYQPAAVILGRDNRFAVYLPDYVEWLASRYMLFWEGAKGGRVYLAPRQATSE